MIPIWHASSLLQDQMPIVNTSFYALLAKGVVKMAEYWPRSKRIIDLDFLKCLCIA